MAMSLTIGESKIVIKQVSLDATTAGPQVGSENPAGCDHSLAPRAEVEQLREAETSEGGPRRSFQAGCRKQWDPPGKKLCFGTGWGTFSAVPACQDVGFQDFSNKHQ